MSVVAFDPLKDSRHKDAASAREQADWLAWLELGGMASRTLEDYEWATAKAMRMFPGKTLADFTDGDIGHVLRSYPVKSRRHRAAAYRSWFKWGVRTRRITQNPMDFLPDFSKTPQKVPEVFSDAEIELLTGLPPVDGTLMLILFDAGLRKGEARRLKVRHVRPDPPQIVVLGGKGGKDRTIPLTARLSQALAELTLLEGLSEDDHFWYSTRANEVSRRILRQQPVGEGTFHRWWGRCLSEAGVRYRNPHVARHTYATRCLRRGVPIHRLKRWMGHESIKTTSDLYEHLTTEDDATYMQLLESVHTEGHENA